VKGPSADDWGFEALRKADRERAEALEAAGPPEALVEVLRHALDRAIERGEIRIGLDSVRNEFVECRVTVQIPVEVSFYDCFLNSRMGYRAQFWISPDAGMAFNAELARACRDLLALRLPARVRTRRILARFLNDDREEEDVGEITTPLSLIHHSLEPDAAKIWICERLMKGKIGQSDQIWMSIFPYAEQDPKLSIPRWAFAKNPKNGMIGQGLWAPAPHADNSWLDLKGAFVRKDGTASQIKSQVERARALHELGWT
jgi:hypothetical protein